MESAFAARRILDQGGNAVDAAVAAVAAQGVVAPETCGIGGDLFALIHRPGWDRPRALNASGRAGSGVRDARHALSTDDGPVPRDHPLAVTVPGCVDGLIALSNELGGLPLSTSLQPAIDLAEDGFVVSNDLAGAFRRQQTVYGDNPAVAELYPGGRPVESGDVVARPRLGATLRGIAAEGRDFFYLGTPGRDVIDAVGGIITFEDLGRSQSTWVEPIGVDVSGLSAWTIPPNSQGYLGPGALAVFEMLGPPRDPSDPSWWHLLIEAYRCLAWEQADVVADPDHAPMPESMYLDSGRLERAAATVSPDRAGVWPDRIGEVSGTAYLCVADGEGLAVSIIQSNYHGTGSPFGAARSGFLLHDRGAGFTLTEGHPNQIEPGKRPLHTLSPTLWTDRIGPRWLLGTRGGAIQPQLICQVAARAIAGHETPEVALEAPRWAIADFGPGSPPRLSVEPGVPAPILEELRARGHEIEEVADRQPGWGPVSIIEIDGDTLRAAADPRVDTSQALIW